MYRKLFLVSLALLVTFTIYTGTNQVTIVEANEGEKIKESINEAQKKQEELGKESEKAEAELKKIEAEVKQTESEIRKLDEQVNVTNTQIDNKQAEIDKNKENIEELSEEIVVLEERIAQRDELLKDRVRSMYKNGGTVNYIEVILGAQSFGDLLERVSALNIIAQQDRNILEQHFADMEALEVAKNDLEEALESLENQMAELEELRVKLDAQLEEKSSLVEALVEKGLSIEGQLASLEEENEFQRAQEAAAAQELALWEAEQKRLEEERKEAERKEAERKEAASKEAASKEAASKEAARKEAERKEADRKKQEKATASQSSTSSSSGSSSTSAATTTASTSSGVFHRPANGRITSNYNPNRVHPIYGTVRSHNGIDFGRDGGLNIMAAEAGTVIDTQWRSGFGNTITISHVVNGKSVTTLYAHLSSFKVSPGQRVTRGQSIAVMGTTGDSTGVHLHFEVHPGGYRGGGSAVNPNSWLW